MYDAMTIDDMYEVYGQLGLGNGDIFTCVTVAAGAYTRPLFRPT
jgi:hypothetical protein